MLAFLAWYLLISCLGWLTVPLAYRLFPALADRGYALARTLGLLLWGASFWLLASLGFVRNNVEGLLLTLFLLAGGSLWSLSRLENGGEGAGRLTVSWRAGAASLWGWLKANRRLVFAVEALFLLTFAGWAVVRAANPEVLGTEKPMELAFINAILRSETFPPHDPWLSGYAISYYYFGYVLTAMLAKLTGVLGSVAFNLMLALVCGLAASGAYGLLYDLLAVWREERGTAEETFSLGLPLLGPLFLLLVSNLEGFLELLHRQGLFWRRNPDGTAASSFWTWLDIKELNLPPSGAPGWMPDRYMWWWRASRVIQDFDLQGRPLGEVIDEFPFFSFLLGDLHPHVLAIPFGLLAVAAALHLFRGGWRARAQDWRIRLSRRAWAWIGAAAVLIGAIALGAGIARVVVTVREVRPGVLPVQVPLFDLVLPFLIVLFCLWAAPLLLDEVVQLPLLGWSVFVRRDLGEHTFRYPLEVSPAGLLLIGLLTGGMAFLNIWDILFGLALFCGAYLLERWLQCGRGWARLAETALFALPVIGLAGAFYLPFFVSFSSQAGGILPNLVAPTRGVHLWVMFAPLLLPIFAYLIYLRRGEGRPAAWGGGLGVAAALAALLWGFSWLLTLPVRALHPEVVTAFLDLNGVASLGDLFAAALGVRLSAAGGWLTLLLLLGMTLAYLLRAAGRGEAKEESSPRASSAATIFVLFLILVGGLLVLGPEYLYLRDLFGTRMNTVFKFYYQAWMVWSLAAAFGTAILLRRLRGVAGEIFRVGLTLLLMVSLTYPLLGLLSRTNNFRPSYGWTLDGAAYLEYGNRGDADAIRWLQTAPFGVVAEAGSPGGSYTYYSRFSTYTGLPTVLGWPGHEGQWRGGYELQGNRQADLQRLYTTLNWPEAQMILERYEIRYVVVGPLERATYPLEEGKFQQHLILGYQNDEVTIYVVP
ncbi:MAG: DUF2298 domain-containing protein [Anaerolineales bacterium]